MIIYALNKIENKKYLFYQFYVTIFPITVTIPICEIFLTNPCSFEWYCAQTIILDNTIFYLLLNRYDLSNSIGRRSVKSQFFHSAHNEGTNNYTAKNLRILSRSEFQS